MLPGSRQPYCHPDVLPEPCRVTAGCKASKLESCKIDRNFLISVMGTHLSWGAVRLHWLPGKQLGPKSSVTKLSLQLPPKDIQARHTDNDMAPGGQVHTSRCQNTAGQGLCRCSRSSGCQNSAWVTPPSETGTHPGKGSPRPAMVALLFMLPLSL